mmetsp:Transcript_61262/g.133085  ORF Transcript_61262/g.133085 Transcript_61262/m.133085 type:complete len:448 (+) Transcript_61262:2-1345(+)
MSRLFRQLGKPLKALTQIREACLLLERAIHRSRPTKETQANMERLGCWKIQQSVLHVSMGQQWEAQRTAIDAMNLLGEQNLSLYLCGELCLAVTSMHLSQPKLALARCSAVLHSCGLPELTSHPLLRQAVNLHAVFAWLCSVITPHLPPKERRTWLRHLAHTDELVTPSSVSRLVAQMMQPQDKGHTSPPPSKLPVPSPDTSVPKSKRLKRGKTHNSKTASSRKASIPKVLPPIRGRIGTPVSEPPPAVSAPLIMPQGASLAPEFTTPPPQSPTQTTASSRSMSGTARDLVVDFARSIGPAQPLPASVGDAVDNVNNVELPPDDALALHLGLNALVDESQPKTSTPRLVWGPQKHVKPADDSAPVPQPGNLPLGVGELVALASAGFPLQVPFIGPSSRGKEPRPMSAPNHRVSPITFAPLAPIDSPLLAQKRQQWNRDKARPQGDLI